MTVDVQKAIADLGRIDTIGRRREALDRLDVLREKHRPLVERRIKGIYSDKDVTRGMLAWSDLSKLVNPARDLVMQIACAYQLPVWRSLAAESDSERKRLQKVWDRVHVEAKTTIKARVVNRMAYGIGPTAVVPVIRAGRVRLEFFTPHRYVPILDDEDPEGPVAGLAIDLARPRQDAKQLALAVVDREAWRYYDGRGQPIAGPEGQHVVAHGCVDEFGEPLCPATINRVDVQEDDDDWWSASRVERLYTATILGGVVLARMMYVRQYQDSNALISKLPSQSEIEAQGVIGHPALPVVITGPTAQHAEIGIVNMATSPEEHLRVLNFIISAAALGEGFPPEAVTISTPLDVGKMQGSRAPSISVKAGHRALLRNGQIELMRPWETELGVAIVATMRGGKLPLADELPPIDELRSMIRTEWSELDSIDDPGKRREQDQWEIERGLASRVDIYRRRKPDLTRAEALDELKRNAEEDGEIHQILAARNQPRDPRAQALEPVGSSLTPAQSNGAMGPAIRDANKRNDNDDDE
jgi:hypothetical protein